VAADCQLNAISDNDAVLTLEGSIQGLNLKEFFLLLSSTGLAYRRCELVRVNGSEWISSSSRAKTRRRDCPLRPITTWRRAPERARPQSALPRRRD